MSAGTLTSADVTAFYLERISRLNPALHAVITVVAVTAATAIPNIFILFIANIFSVVMLYFYSTGFF